MPRPRRLSTADYVYHVLNRAGRRSIIFRSAGDYAAFEHVLFEGRAKFAIRLLAYCCMPNHWHLLLWPKADDALSRFMKWVTGTHSQRHHVCHGTNGTGPLYQGRFKSIPVASDHHLLWVCRYIERNPVRAGLVARAEDWQWSSLRHRQVGSPPWRLDDLPVPLPPTWAELVNVPQTAAELEAFRVRVLRGAPFGGCQWSLATAQRLGLPTGTRARGRPLKRGLTLF